ncbi:hypothetical protein GUJ93_ZPchr0006g43736 [Zizania palustris]|uniref:AMP-dependent synthetase/ligase domain-containing protein n=1 Tax=Zizania palustris TaxID=103762 RepID=A0A8J5TE06_ZIZPA|nr:hypothetical protein GUJ93_ZPchr0006g43736 [Zizania palustris]
MRAASQLLRRLARHSSIASPLHHRQPCEYYSAPHSDCTTNLASPGATILSPWRWRHRCAFTFPSGGRSLLFSSLVGSGEEEEEEAEEVLDMEAGTVRCAANYTPLTPISFIERAADVYGDRAAVVCGDRRHTWREARGRCVRVAGALATRFGVARGDVVSAIPTHHVSLSL